VAVVVSKFGKTGFAWTKDKLGMHHGEARWCYNKYSKNEALSTKIGLICLFNVKWIRNLVEEYIFKKV